MSLTPPIEIGGYKYFVPNGDGKRVTSANTKKRKVRLELCVF